MPRDNVCLCIHGHFYQPPRENPWLEALELQESAAPYHDWNERIHQECYSPNTQARVLDDRGRVINIVNNYQKMSFNFGPTLLSWLVAKHPEDWQEILHADQLSCAEHDGHGNAMAQVYNHMIMPLANDRDKRTQVRWGIEEFKYRFGREPESIWLPETACNDATLEILIEEGIKFVILEPHQAEAVRPLDSDQWTDVSSGKIDPKRPYRYFLNTPSPSPLLLEGGEEKGEGKRRFIDIFFYDGPISKDAGFGPLAWDAKIFASRLESAVQGDFQDSQLIHIATDGETYGHHKPYGERALAYLLNIEARKRGFRMVNYAQFLEKFPPNFAVRIKAGENGEGTSWSCAHGVKRWKDHCGCRGDGPAEWTQYWRRPLREALDWLRDELVKVYEEKGRGYLKDVWQARHDYISLILDRSEENIQNFFERHAARPLSREEQVTCLKLLESQRHAMLMYTSCGWFFTELSGIETVQVLQYAARAIQLMQEAAGICFEDEFLTRLEAAKSNVPEYKDGRRVYEHWVKPRMISLPHIVSYYAVMSTLDEFYREEESFPLYCFQINVLYQRRESFGDLTLNYGRVKITSRVTMEQAEIIFIALKIGAFDFRCSLKPFSALEEFERIEKELFEELHSVHFVELLRKIDGFFGTGYYDLKDIPFEDRTKIISLLSREIIGKINAAYENLYDENRQLNEIYRAIRLPIPEEIRYATEHTLTHRLKIAVERLAVLGFDLRKARPVYRIIEAIKSFSKKIPKDEVPEILSKALEKRTRQMTEDLKPEIIQGCLNILKLSQKIEVALDLRKPQEDLFSLAKKWSQDPQSIPVSVQGDMDSFYQLLSDLHISPEPLKKALARAPTVK